MRQILIALGAVLLRGAAPAQRLRPALSSLVGSWSCPPVNIAVARARAQPGAIAPGADVIDGDHAGWKHRFARRESANRQGGYAKAPREDWPSAPEMVAGGHGQPSGSRGLAIYSPRNSP